MVLVLASCFWCESPRPVFLLQVIGHTPRNENLPQVGSMAPSPASSGTPASFQGPPSMMDTETDEYMDYTGCSPGGISSESSNMDRSCSSTPVGNESTSAGKKEGGVTWIVSCLLSWVINSRREAKGQLHLKIQIAPALR